ncbi:MAG: serine/threonine protein kinase [Gemmataceae bacterium]|nr:serine/threonine protein kinase [Gemmataceae bacterium]
MNNADSLVLEYLVSRAGFAGHQIEHLRRWWQATAAEETLLGFLQRQGLLSSPSMQIFQQIAGGHLTRGMGFTLLDPHEFLQIRRRLPEVTAASEMDPKATMTLFGSDETAPEMPRLPVSPEPPRIGGFLGKYLLTEWLGKGANGNVFRALHPTLHIPVAIKVLNAGTGHDDHQRLERLKIEARLLARLNHPNIVRVYDFEDHPQYPFLVLEHVNGPSLAELIEQCGRIQPDRVIRLAKQLAEGLAAAHRLGVVHRDIKPANVLLTRTGEVKLADLGLAIMRRIPGSFGGTASGESVSRGGTALYIAPELVTSASPPDERSDMYSLGATLFHALTGRPPFEGSDPWQVIENAVKQAPPCPRRFVPDLPPDLAELVTRMLAKDPLCRPYSFVNLLLEPVFSGTLPPARPIGSGLWTKLMQRWWRRQRRLQSV